MVGCLGGGLVGDGPGSPQFPDRLSQSLGGGGGGGGEGGGGGCY